MEGGEDPEERMTLSFFHANGDCFYGDIVHFTESMLVPSYSKVIS